MEIGHGELSQIAKYIWLIATPFVFVVGVIGNLIAIAVFMKPRNRTSSTSIYFIWLAFADTTALLVDLPRWWVVYGVHYDIRHYSDFVCKLHMFGIVYSTTLSSWVLMALTIERLISTVRPHHVKALCTPRSANIVCICVVLLIMLVSGMMMYGYGITYLPPPGDNKGLHGNKSLHSNETLHGNEPLRGNEALHSNEILHDNATLDINATGCDTVFTFDCNTIETETVGTSLGKPTDRVPMTTTPVREHGIDENAICTWYRDKKSAIARRMDEIIQFFVGFLLIQIAMIVSDIIIIYKLVSIGIQRKSRKPGGGHIRQITITLVLVNIVFLVCRTPLYIFMSFINNPELDAAPETLEIAWAIINVLFFTNHAVNFFLYVLIGKRFRTQVYEMLCGWKNVDKQETTNNTSLTLNTVA